MNHQLHRWTLATALWTVSVGLMIVRGLDPAADYLADWSLLVAFGALTATISAVIVRERMRNETIANAVCHYSKVLEAEDKVDRIR